MGSVPNCRKEIADCYPIRWFKCKLKPPKNLGIRRYEIVKEQVQVVLELLSSGAIGKSTLTRSKLAAPTPKGRTRGRKTGNRGAANAIPNQMRNKRLSQPIPNQRFIPPMNNQWSSQRFVQPFVQPTTYANVVRFTGSKQGALPLPLSNS